MKKLISFVMAAVLCVGMSTTVFADTTSSEDTVAKVESALEGISVADGADAVIDAITAAGITDEELETAIASSQEVNDLIYGIEMDLYSANEVGLAVDVFTDAIDSSKVGLSLGTGVYFDAYKSGISRIALVLAEPVAEEDVASYNFTNMDQIDISLYFNGEKAVNPIGKVTVITPLPNGVTLDTDSLRVLHFHNGEATTPEYRIDGDMIQITVDNFSTFVFGNVGQGNADSGSGNQGGSQSPSAGTVVTPSAPVESEHTLPNGEEVRMVTVKGNSNVYVIGNPDIIPTGAVFESVAVTTGDIFANAKTAVEKKFGAVDFEVFEMNLKDAKNQAIHELGGFINVTLPVPAGMAADEGETIVVYCLENGKLTKCDTAVANGQVTFATNHFSTYVLVEVNAMTSPKTGDINMMPAMATLVLMMGAAVVVFARRRAN